MNKLLMFAFVNLILILGCKPAPSGGWVTNLEDAYKLATKENKTILVNFTGSDWCIWCKRLDKEVFSEKAFTDFAAKKLILVKIDFPRDTEQSPDVKAYNRKLAEKYNIEGFPTILLLSGDGKVKGVTGYQPGGAAAYVEHLNKMM